jgi:hypothetical protein
MKFKVSIAEIIAQGLNAMKLCLKEFEKCVQFYKQKFKFKLMIRFSKCLSLVLNFIVISRLG